MRETRRKDHGTTGVVGQYLQVPPVESVTASEGQIQFGPPRLKPAITMCY